MMVVSGLSATADTAKGRNVGKLTLLDGYHDSGTRLNLFEVGVVLLTLISLALCGSVVSLDRITTQLSPLFSLRVFLALLFAAFSMDVSKGAFAHTVFALRLIPARTIRTFVESIKRLRNTSKMAVRVGTDFHEVFPCQPCLMEGVDSLTRLGIHTVHEAVLVHTCTLYHNKEE